MFPCATCHQRHWCCSLGPDYAVAIAFLISCLRNMFGTGSLLAFPGSMIGAFIAGMAYKHWKKYSFRYDG